jgi:hypothetical protein
MPTLLECAALSAVIYNDQRGGGGGQTTTNTLPPPPGWQDLSLLGFTPGGDLNNYNPFSFTAGAYINQRLARSWSPTKAQTFLLNSVAEYGTRLPI